MMKLRLSGIQHAFADNHLLFDIPAWEVEGGQQLLLKGVSGSGKTTLFNIIAGLLQPTHGEIYFDSQPLYELTPRLRDRFRARHIGYIFQNHYLLPALTALENVVMPLAFAKLIPSSQWQSLAQKLLIDVGLGDHLHYRPHQLSTGQRLRVAIARALISQPKVLLADEPTASLDGVAAQNMMDILQTQARQQGSILIVSSHDPALSQRFELFAYLASGQLTLTEGLPNAV